MAENQESNDQPTADLDMINTCTSCEYAYRDPNKQPCYDCLKGQPYHLWQERS